MYDTVALDSDDGRKARRTELVDFYLERLSVGRLDIHVTRFNESGVTGATIVEENLTVERGFGDIALDRDTMMNTPLANLDIFHDWLRQPIDDPRQTLLEIAQSRLPQSMRIYASYTHMRLHYSISVYQGTDSCCCGLLKWDPTPCWIPEYPAGCCYYLCQGLASELFGCCYSCCFLR